MNKVLKKFKQEVFSILTDLIWAEKNSAALVSTISSISCPPLRATFTPDEVCNDDDLSLVTVYRLPFLSERVLLPERVSFVW